MFSDLFILLSQRSIGLIVVVAACTHFPLTARTPGSLYLSSPIWFRDWAELSPCFILILYFPHHTEKITFGPSALSPPKTGIRFPSPLSSLTTRSNSIIRDNGALHALVRPSPTRTSNVRTCCFVLWNSPYRPGPWPRRGTSDSQLRLTRNLHV